ncbi:NUDIX hydrolase [Marinithermus hydrothermalis]|uniref:NUDIX hydrolase n=1 Tax=Marinithermus hydrothermalis (strain DSM 14884 / JCM 11576 / T1) TaxID=869210 RepID=F2NPR6_MARHT|nr:NUDIX hydrolase [Marinithermus hydrothermalis DSM 14884]
MPVLASGEVLFTVRSATLPHHGGQISFPGGMQEPGETPEAAALREAWEEVALPPEAVEVLGRLDQTTSPFGFRITPVVGWIPHLPDLSPNPAEVARILRVPFAELLGAPAWAEVREHAGRKRQVWHYPWRGYDIWGVTGNIVHDLLTRYRETNA